MVRVRPVRTRGVLWAREVERVPERPSSRVVARLRVRDEVLGHRVDLAGECVLVVRGRDGRRLAVRLAHRLALILKPAGVVSGAEKKAGAALTRSARYVQTCRASLPARCAPPSKGRQCGYMSR